MYRIKGVKKIASESRKLKRGYLQVNCCDTGDDTIAWCDYHSGICGKSWTVHERGDVINCGFINSPTSMAEIQEMIERAIEANKEWLC